MNDRRPPTRDPSDDPADHPSDGPTDGPADHPTERLQKVLARAGLGSRRHCDELISSGRVRVDGEVAPPGKQVDPVRARITVDGALVPVDPELVYYLLNKPAGVVTTMADTHGRPMVTSLVPDHPRVFPVGRLDLETEGLLILTNDGTLAQELTHPSHGVEKEYMAQVEGRPSAGALRRLRQGVELDDGPTAPATVGVLGPGALRIVIHEGRNRQVRRMCEAIGHPVRRLVRTRIGPLSDTTLAPGSWRPLTGHEVRALARASAGRHPRAGRRGGPVPTPGSHHSIGGDAERGDSMGD